MTPVNLLDSSSAGSHDSGGPFSSTPETPISRPDTPSVVPETSVSRPDTPAASVPEVAVSRLDLQSNHPKAMTPLVRHPREHKHPRKDAKSQANCIEQRYQQRR